MTFGFIKWACLLDLKRSLSSLRKAVIGSEGVEGVSHKSTIVSKYNAALPHTSFAYNEHQGDVCGGQYSGWDGDFFVKTRGITMG